TPVSGNVLTNDTDIENNSLTVTQFQIGTTIYAAGTTATIPGVGTLVINPNGTFNFTPVLNYTGPVPVAVYTVSDGNGGTDTANLTLGPVTPANDAPVAIDDTLTATEDRPLTGNVLSNDTDADNNPLTVTQFTIGGTTYPAGSTATIPGVGTLVINADGTFTFTPVANYNGPVPVASYTISDGNGGTDSGTLTLTVAPVNDAPIARPDTTTTRFARPVVVNLTANDIDVENGPLTVKSASVPANQGRLVNNGGVWTFIPARGFTGAATITYTIVDNQGAESTSTHTVTVGLPPISAKNDRSIGAFNRSFTSTVAFNDVYEKGAKFSVVKQPAGGKVVMRPDGTFKFTPKRGFSGVATFTYRITDSYGQTVTARQTIVVSTEKHNCLVTFGKIKKR
ncbi:MAG: Ig-like domain-containing protein, partial [Hyphomonas sp.]|nr:Ig-like domain-containing protein [Hyphomonas sp.]